MRENTGHFFDTSSTTALGCPRVKIDKIISLEILELRADNPPTRVLVCQYRLSFWSNSPTRPYGARNGPLRYTMGCVEITIDRSLALSTSHPGVPLPLICTGLAENAYRVEVNVE